MPVQLQHGDVFEGPSDLIVVPCSTIPTITDFVARHLRDFDIPSPSRPMTLGEVEIVPFDGAENVAPYVAFAASVKGLGGSSEDAIRAIADGLGAFTVEQRSVQVVTTPLLGTGAGELEPVAAASALRDGFTRACEPAATLRIVVLDEGVYDDVRAAMEQSAAPEQPLRVFISYTGTSAEHRRWVADLGEFLAQNGVYARLDQWDLDAGMNVAQWMTNELTLADRVLMVCDEQYAQKADGLHGGVGWEMMLVQGDLLRSGLDTKKYVAVVRTADPDEGLPSFVKAQKFIHWPPGGADNAARQELLQTIFGVPRRPPLGKPPAWL